MYKTTIHPPLHEPQASRRSSIDQSRNFPSYCPQHPPYVRQLGAAIVVAVTRRRQRRFAAAEQISDPLANGTTFACASTPAYISDPVIHNKDNDFDDAVAHHATESIVLRVKNVFQHADNHVV